MMDTLSSPQTIINNLPGFVYRCANDPSWTMFYISEGCRSVTGYAPGDFIGNSQLSFADIILPEHRRWGWWQERLAQGLPLEDEYPIRTAQGEIRWVWERGFGVSDEHGVCLYIEGFVTDITQRKQAEQALARREEQYRLLFELSPVEIIVEDHEGTILDVNKAVTLRSGYARDELLGKNIRLFVPEQDWPSVDTNLAALQQGATIEEEVIAISREGQVQHKLLRERAIPLNGEKMGVLSFSVDISELKRAEKLLQKSERKYRSLVEHMLEGMIIMDIHGRVVLANPAALRMFEVASTEELCANKFTPSNLRDAVLLLNIGEGMTTQHFFTRQGKQVWLELHGAKIEMDGEEAVLVLLRDITKRKEDELQREYLSWHDPLTGLYNRRHFEQAIEGCTCTSPGVVVVDLDGLKLINDTLGHSAGDHLLRATAAILRECSRNEDLVSRIGGDEFVIFMHTTDRVYTAGLVSSIKARTEEYNKQHPDIPLSLSVGCEVAGSDHGGLTHVYRAADNAMYRDKLLHKKSSRSTLSHVLLSALDGKNVETREHVERLGQRAAAMARQLGHNEHWISEIDLFARFHDIGKVGVADSILTKPGPLTPAERQEMERHSEIGYRIAVASPELAPIAEFILKHQERWDGEGYPLGLLGEDIPLPCRIVAIVDAYDAMTNDRPYRRALSVAQALAELHRCAGTQFDPTLVELFSEVYAQDGFVVN